MKVGSLRVRLLLAASVSILVALALAAFGLAYLFERHVEGWVDAQLEVAVNELIAGVRPTQGAEIELGDPPSDPRFGEPLSGLYWQVERQPGGQVLRSRSLWDFAIALPDIPVDDNIHRAELAGPGGARLYVVMRHVEGPKLKVGGTILAAAAIDGSELRAAVWRFTSALLPFLLLVGGLLVTAAWIQVGVGLKPLAAMREALSGIRAGTRKRLGRSFPDEVRPLAAEIDGLLDARDAQLDKARAEAADLAHGLKTHLQVLSGEAKKLEARGAEDVGAEIDSLAQGMLRHVQRHLARARLSPPGREASANLADVVARVVRVVRRTEAGERLAWSETVPPDLAARMDPDDLAEALGNLIENAARHARTKVAISATDDEDHAVLTVFDDGPGIPEGDREEVLKRGRRLDVSRPGSGLGLAIVADIAEASGATLSFEDRPDGFSATLRIPRAQPERKSATGTEPAPARHR